MAVSPARWNWEFCTLIFPETPAPNGSILATSATLSMLCPCSSKYIASSAKYSFHGSLLPGATASDNSWVRRTISAWVIGAGLLVTQEVRDNSAHTNRVAGFKASSTKSLDRLIAQRSVTDRNRWDEPSGA